MATGIASNPNALHALARFRELGWSAVQTYGMVGNDWQESLMVPAIVGDKGLADQAHGIAQWRAERFDNLKLFAAARGRDWTDLDVQIDYQNAELRGLVGTEKAHGDRLAAATTVEAAVEAAIGYHRPRGYTLAKPRNGHGWANRLANAQALAAAAAAPKPAPAPVIADAIAASEPQSLVAALRTVPGGILEQGASGSVVVLAQRKLAALGYALTGTGNFAGATDVAVRDYQTKRGLSVDGQIGPLTAADIDSMAGKKMPDAPTNSPVDYPLWVKFALAQVGVVEKTGAGNNPVIMAWAKAEGGSVAKSYTADSIPWCALFQNMVFTKCGIRGTETLWALDWNEWGIKLSGPAVGAVAPMKREGGGHVFTVLGKDKAGNIIGVGGNQSDAVNIRGVPKERPLSYRWPTGVALPKLVGYGYLPIVDANGKILTKAS